MAQEVIIPHGFRFYPTDEEVIRMVGCLEEGEGEGLLYGIGGEVIEADPFGEDEPWELFARYGKETEKVVYFATTLKRKFHKGTKICRTVGRTRGSWASQNNFPVKNGNRRRNNNNNIIGWKRSLRYENKSNSSQTGQWLMTEFNLRQEAKPNDLVICKIQNKKKDEQEQVPSSSTLLDNNQLFIQQQSPATVVDGSTTEDANYYNQHDLGNAAAMSKPVVEYNGNNDNGLLHLPGETITSTVGDECYYTTTNEDANANLSNYYYDYDDQLILDSSWATMRPVVPMDYHHRCNNINNNDQEFHQAETLISPSTKDANYYNQHDLANAVATAKPLVENYGNNENRLLHLPGETITSTVGDDYCHTTTKEDANANLNNYHYNYDDQLILDSGWAMARTVVSMDYDNDHRNNINDDDSSTTKDDDDDAANLYYYPKEVEVEVNHHDDQLPILDNGAGAQPEPAVVCDDNVKVKLLDEVVMADPDEAERTLLDIDGFVKQLMEGAEDDLLMEDSENIHMLPGPDPFTENYLLC